VVGVNFYMFRHRIAIFRDSIKKKVTIQQAIPDINHSESGYLNIKILKVLNT